MSHLQQTLFRVVLNLLVVCTTITTLTVTVIMRIGWNEWKWRMPLKQELLVRILQKILYSQLVSNWRHDVNCCKLLLRHPNFVCDREPHVTHLVSFLQTGSTARNPTTMEPLPSVDNIAVIAKLETHEDAIWWLGTKLRASMTCLLKETFRTMYQIVRRLGRKLFLRGAKFCNLST